MARMAEPLADLPAVLLRRGVRELCLRSVSRLWERDFTHCGHQAYRVLILIGWFTLELFFTRIRAQAVMMMLDDSTDLLEVLEACVEGRLDSVAVGVRDGFAVTVIAVSEGYPGSYPKGRPISLGSVKGVCPVY
jgi:hypothetical protein